MKKVILILLMIVIVQIVYAENDSLIYDGNWDTYMYANYSKPDLDWLEWYVREAGRDFNQTVMNVTGTYSNGEFICFPTNETLNNITIFNCSWTKEPEPILYYEEAIWWNNLTEPPCNWWCKISNYFKRFND